MDTEYFTVDEVANLLKVSTRTVTNYCKSGKIECLKLAREWRISKEALEKFIKNNQFKGECKNDEQ